MKFISSDSYRTYAKYFYHVRTGFVAQDSGRSDTYFVRSDVLGDFTRLHLSSIKSPFYLITGDCDHTIYERFPGSVELLNNPYLIRWFGININFIHKKVFSTPIGLTYSGERERIYDDLSHVMNMNVPKDRVVYANYTIDGPRHYREECLKHTGLMFPKKNFSSETGFQEYLTEVGRSLFNISPSGGGTDCYRHWESLYLKTIPIVVDDNINMRFYINVPFLRLRSWSQFNMFNLTKDLYNKIWNDFDISRLSFDKYMAESLVKKHPIQKGINLSLPFGERT